MYDVLRADRCISGWSMEARVPFGDLDFVEYVMSVDPALKVNRCGKGKYLLRRPSSPMLCCLTRSCGGRRRPSPTRWATLWWMI